MSNTLKVGDTGKYTVSLEALGVAKTKNGGNYTTGAFRLQSGEQYNFKYWSGDLRESFENGAIVDMVLTCKDYNGSLSIIADIVVPTETTLVRKDFLVTTLDVKSLLQRYNDVVSGFSANATAIKDELFKDKEMQVRFLTEFAAVRHHDSQPSGLFNHTVKMLEYASLVVKQHSSVLSQDEQDLILLGTLIHDVGKIVEYNDGLITEDWYLSHRYFGLKIIENLEDKIIEVYSQEFYNHLVAIILQHHGIYEEKPKTVYSYVVHLIDMFETALQTVNEGIQGDDDHIMISFSDGSRGRLQRYKGGSK